MVAEEKKVSIFSRIVRSVRNMRGEMKRVVWPSRKQVINNTSIVLVFMALAALVIGSFDALMAFLISRTLGA